MALPPVVAPADSGQQNIAPDQNEPGADGNFQSGGQPEPIQNNTGQADDFTQFWEEPKEEGDANLGSPSATPSDSVGSPDQQANPMAQLDTMIQSIQFDDVMTDDVSKAINENDMSGFNAGMAKMGQAAVKQSLIMAARMMGELQTKMQASQDARFEELMSADKSEQALHSALPFSQQPQFAPIAKGIFAQAMKHTGGDRAKALTMTERFFVNITKDSASDLGLGVAPRGEGDVFDQQDTEETNWLDALMVRG